ncbi:hypothetical protein FRC07_010592 [Ceratobasidium sp. 392]|nr:hypothetical protein FRC07_010592 [Ceratobasidium sp. 392]
MAIETHSHRVPPSTGSTSGALPTSTNPQARSSPRPTLSAPLPSIKIKKRSARAVHRQSLRDKRKELDLRLLAAKKKFVSDVTELGKEYHKSPREIQSRALLKNKFGIQKRKVNAYNAFRHKQSKARKAAGESQSFDEVQGDDLASYRDAAPDDIEAARKELEAEKEVRSGLVQKNPRARVQHLDKVIRGIDASIKEINFSCEAEALCFFVNGSNRDHPVLQAVYTPKGLAFLEGPLKHNINNLLHDFQTFAQAGSKGVAKSHKDLQVELRAQVSALLLRSLQAAVGDATERIGKMKYSNFEERVCRKYNVKLVGWPEALGEVRNPSTIGNKDLKHLVAMLKSGTCYFEKGSSDDTE